MANDVLNFNTSLAKLYQYIDQTISKYIWINYDIMFSLGIKRLKTKNAFEIFYVFK